MSMSTLDFEHGSMSPPTSDVESAESPSDDSQSQLAQSPAPNPGPFEWLRLTDVIFAVFQGGVPHAVTWSAAAITVLSFPNQTGTTPRSTWYLSLESEDSLGQIWHTIDLSDRAWVVEIEESSLTFMFDFGNIEAGNGQRYFIKTGCHTSFSYLLNHVCYIKGCAVGAFLETRQEPN